MKYAVVLRMPARGRALIQVVNADSMQVLAEKEVRMMDTCPPYDRKESRVIYLDTK